MTGQPSSLKKELVGSDFMKLSCFGEASVHDQESAARLWIVVSRVVTRRDVPVEPPVQPEQEVPHEFHPVRLNGRIIKEASAGAVRVDHVFAL